MTKTDAQNDLGSTAGAVSARTGSTPFGNFELGSVEVVGEEGDDFEAATHSGFVTIGDAVQIEIEGPNAPAIAAFIVCACNAHADLLANAKWALGMLRALQPKMAPTSGPGVEETIASWEAGMRDLRAALALAEPSST